MMRIVLGSLLCDVAEPPCEALLQTTLWNPRACWVSEGVLLRHLPDEEGTEGSASPPLVPLSVEAPPR